MTKEVAEKIVRGITDKIECNTVDIDDWAEFWGFTREEYEEFLDMAIKALEQQPCEDCIRRQEVNELVDELARAISDERSFMSRGRSTSAIMEDILHLSSVKPQPEFYPPCQDCNTKMDEVRRAYDRCRWIPCSERLPETSGVYLVTGHFYNEPYEIWLCEFTDFEIVKGWCNPASRPIVEYWMIAPELPK